MDKQSEMLEAEVTFLPEREGGRRFLPEGIARTGKYCPHIVIGDPNQREPVRAGTRITEVYYGVLFVDGPNHIEFGQPQIFKMVLPFWNPSEYSGVVAEATFTLREGPQIIGFGRIIHRWRADLKNDA